MKKGRKIIILVLMVFLITGCTKNLKDENNNVITNKETGQAITENIICQPTEEDVRNIYIENGVDLDKLPVCKNFTPLDNYEGIWTSFFVKPLSWVIIQIGLIVKNYGLAIIITALLIRLILMPITGKTAMQSENMKKAQPEIQKLEKK